MNSLVIKRTVKVEALLFLSAITTVAQRHETMKAIPKNNDNFLQKFIKKVFGTKQKSHTAANDDKIPEPKYWLEVQTFIENLKYLISTHTDDSENSRRINENIINYIEDQINQKGSISNKSSQQEQILILADKILVHSLNKIAGLKPQTTSKADFSDAVKDFKIQIKNRFDRDS